MTATATKSKPIMFSGPMVRAILEGRKTQTRMTSKLDHVNEAPDTWCRPCQCSTDGRWVFTREDGPAEQLRIAAHYGKPGDRLYVKEALHLDLDCGWQYADTSPMRIPAESYDDAELWMTTRPAMQKYVNPMLMPRWASRITLEVTNVRVQRLQEISEEDAMAEGVDQLPSAPPMRGHQRAFKSLWNSINGATHPWESNPWVWVYDFQRVAQGASDA